MISQESSNSMVFTDFVQDVDHFAFRGGGDGSIFVEDGGCNHVFVLSKASTVTLNYGIE